MDKPKPTPKSTIQESTSFKNPRELRSDHISTNIKVAYKEGVVSWSWFRIKSILGINKKDPLQHKQTPSKSKLLLPAYGLAILAGGLVKGIVSLSKFVANPVKFFTTSNNHHDLLIPETENHAAWILGAQPSELTISDIEGEFTSRRVLIISMLAGKERAIIPPSESVVVKDGAAYIQGKIGSRVVVDRTPWGDHGVICLLGDESQPVRNQTVSSMRAYQEVLYPQFNATPPTETFYCHCMAGKSRSFLESMSFFYFYPDKEKLFDFEKWPDEIKDKIPEELQKRLRDNPSFSDIIEYISLRRPQVKKISKMDGDQAGLLGLMSLAKAAKDGLRITYGGRIAEARLLKDAQHIGLMLKAPLDKAFRDPEDRKIQEENLVSVYKKFQEHKSQPGINLLMAMVVPIDKAVDPKKYNNIEEFEKIFKNLSPNEQARFAILLRRLELENDPTIDLGELRGRSLEYAKIAAKNARKLSAGDQVELLRTFGSEWCDLNYADVVKKIHGGNGVDRYNATIQLAELLNAVS
jgi:hypothetical protein